MFFKSAFKNYDWIGYIDKKHKKLPERSFFDIWSVNYMRIYAKTPTIWSEL